MLDIEIIQVKSESGLEWFHLKYGLNQH